MQITNVYERALALLISQFKDTDGTINKNNMQKLFYALSTMFQKVEDTLWQLKQERSLETAVGVQLDGIGEIVGLDRIDGQSDEEYRLALMFQSFINSSSGTPEQCITALKFFTKATKIVYFDMFPAGFILATNGSYFPPQKLDLCKAMNRIKPAGVSSVPIVLIYDWKPLELAKIEYEAFHVSPDGIESDQLLVNSDDLYVNAGKIDIPSFGGTLAYFGADGELVTIGAGQIVGVLQI